MQKITQYVQNSGQQFPETLLRAFNDLFSRQNLSSAALAVGSTTTKYQMGAISYQVINGVLVKSPVADGPVLTGYNLTSGQIGGFVACVDASGNQSALPIQPAATIGGVGFPQIPANLVAVGVILINTVNAATFTGGTTLMSATSVVYINVTGPFAPTNLF